MGLGPEYWRGKESLTIKQAAILAAGGDPDKKMAFQPNKEVISTIEADLTLEVMSCVEYARTLVESGKMGRYVDQLHDFDIFEHECETYGVYFYKSIAADNFAALDEVRHPSVNTIRLIVREVRMWLRSQQISSKFFFPDDAVAQQDFKPTTQKQRETVLVDLIAQHGKEDLLSRGRPGVWKLLVDADRELFQPHGRDVSESSFRAFFRNQKLLKGFKRGPKG